MHLGLTNAQEQYHVPIEIVEKGEKVEGQFAPALFLAVGQDVGVHDGGGVIKAWPTHHWPAHVPAMCNKIIMINNATL